MRITSSISLSLLLAVAAACGGDGDDGIAQLVDVDSEPAGDNCANGGTVITSGTDDNGDGVLGADEVESTEYVCDPDSGNPADVLVSLADEPAGSNCPAGGTAINIGADDDGSGTLESGEIDSTSYACDGEAGGGTLTAAGTVVIEDAQQLALLGGFDVVEGNLRFEGSELPVDIDLPTLTAVGGELELASGLVETVTLDNLGSVGGLAIGATTPATALTDFSVPMLAGVIAGNVAIGDAPALTAIDLGGVTDVGGDVLFWDDTLLASVDLSLLATVGGELNVDNLDALAAVAVPELTSVTSHFWLSNSLILDTITMPKLATVGGDFYIGQTVATDLSALLLTTVTGDFTIEDNNLLTTLGDAVDGFPVLVTIAGLDIAIQNNDILPCSEVEEIIDDAAFTGMGHTENVAGNENGATDCNAN